MELEVVATDNHLIISYSWLWIDENTQHTYWKSLHNIGLNYNISLLGC